MSNPNTPAQRVGIAVRAEMKRQRISQQQVADLLGITQASVSRRLSGAAPFDVAEIQQVADLLGVPAAAFLQDAA